MHAAGAFYGRSESGAERWLLACAIGLGLGIRLAYVLLTQHYRLRGDAPEYDFEGWMIAHGHFFWTRLPFGVLHASAWKAPGYPAWVGFWYTLLGHDPLALRLVQVLIGAVTIGLTWLLARRLFGPRVALAAAFLVAVYPLAWQYEQLLYPESLATPLTLLALIVLFTRPPSKRGSVIFGVVLGCLTLVRPTSLFMLLAALTFWCISAGWRRGLILTALAAALAALVIAPWTVRNAIVMHGFVPVSLQDAALYGTFNLDSANDPVEPYAWRFAPSSISDVLHRSRPLSDIQFRATLDHRAFSYISAHPGSLPAAFFWNGLSRLWDIRHRSQALAEVPFEGRSRFVTDAGLDMYLVLLPLALLGLWRTRRRRAFVFGVLALALGASIVFTVASGTRYRAPLEPLIAVLACAGLLGVLRLSESEPGCSLTVSGSRTSDSRAAGTS